MTRRNPNQTLLLGMILISACSGTGPSAEEATISGAVIDAETKEFLPGVLVYSVPATERITTGADGRYTLKTGVRFATLYQITAGREGYETLTRTITPSAVEPNILDLELPIQKICTAGAKRCAQGAAEGIETCATRGNLWEPSPCATGNVCDDATLMCIQSHRLTVSSTPNGVVMSQPAGISCGQSCTKDYPAGTSVTLTAVPLTGGEFTGWGGACASNGTTPTCTLSMTGPQSASATFVSNIFGLTVTKMGRGNGTVTSAPAGINCGPMCSAAFDRDLQVMLTAAPANGSMFQRWEGDCTGTTPTCMVTMSAARSVVARFTVPSFPMTVTKAGTGAGLVTSDVAGIDCGSDCAEDFDIGEVVTLTAAENGGSTFMGWSGDCTGTTPDCVVTMDQARDITATFEGVSYPLTITKSGAGAGTVSSAPGGINCGLDCDEAYGPATVVTLTATPDPGSAFGGWTGACLAAGTAPTCMVTMDMALTADAQFDVNLQGLSVTVTGGGVVTSAPAGINCGADCTEAYAPATVVTLTATPNAGQVFTGWGGDCATAGLTPTCMLTINAGLTVTAGFEAFYLRPFAADASCTALFHFDNPMNLVSSCGGAAATLGGTYTSIASRTAALNQAYSAGGVDEEGYIDTQHAGIPGPLATVEMTVRKTGAAFDARGAGVLFSDRAYPGGRGLRVSVLDDGRLVASTRDGTGGTSTASTAVGALANNAWHHVAVTVSATNGLRVFVDGANAAQQLGALQWTASSSTSWVGAEREQGATDAIYRFNGAVDEVRISNTLRY